MTSSLCLSGTKVMKFDCSLVTVSIFFHVLHLKPNKNAISQGKNIFLLLESFNFIQSYRPSANIREFKFSWKRRRESTKGL